MPSCQKQRDIAKKRQDPQSKLPSLSPPTVLLHGQFKIGNFDSEVHTAVESEFSDSDASQHNTDKNSLAEEEEEEKDRSSVVSVDFLSCSSMEETSTEKIEETHQVEPQEEEEREREKEKERSDYGTSKEGIADEASMFVKVPDSRDADDSSSGSSSSDDDLNPNEKKGSKFVESENVEEKEEKEEEDVVPPVILTEAVEIPVVNAESDASEVLTSKNVDEKRMLSEIDGVFALETSIVPIKTERKTTQASDETSGESPENVETAKKELQPGEKKEVSDSADLASKKNVEKMEQQPVDVSPVDTRYGVENTNISESPESMENQPPVSTAPNTLERTSWWSCCGLLEIFKRSRSSK